MKKMREWLAVLAIGVCLLTMAMPAVTVFAKTEPTYELTELTAMAEAYVGTVNVDELNVRSGFGANFDQIKVNGKHVILHDGDKVAVMSVGKSSSGNEWYEVRWVEDEVEYHGYVRGKYVTMSDTKAEPIPTPTPEPTATPIPTPTPTPTEVPEATPTPIITEAPDVNENSGGGFSILKALGILVLLLLIAAAVYVFLMMKKREAAGAETSEKIDSLKNIQIKKEPEAENGYAINVMKRRQTVPEEPQETPTTPAAPARSKTYEADAAILARKEYARMMNEEIMEKSRFFDPAEEKKKEDELKQLSESLKEKELLREEIESLSPGDLVYHEYFGKGVVFDNSDVKRIEIRFGTDVRFVDKSACVAKKLMRKV